jgi:hypothetical protein
VDPSHKNTCVNTLAPRYFYVHTYPVVTNTTTVEFPPLLTTREERGRQIAKLGGIRLLGAACVVPSQSIRGDAPPTYLVDLVEQTCTCPDHAERGVLGSHCKHQEAVLFWLAWEGTVNEDTGQIELPRGRAEAEDVPAELARVQRGADRGEGARRGTR